MAEAPPDLEDDGVLAAHAAAQAEMLEGATQEILELMRNQDTGPQSFRDHVEAFASAIDFHEPFVQGLLTMHVVLLVTMLLFRRSHAVQIALFVVICVVVGLAEPANRWAAENWRSFATQNYFDEHGVFAGSMICGPMLAMGFGQLIGFLATASDLLIKVKREELRRKRGGGQGTGVATGGVAGRPDGAGGAKEE